MEDSHRIAPCEIQGLQPNKDEQTAWKDRSSPPRTILPSAILHPCRGHGGVVGSGSLFPESHISYRRALDPGSLRKSLKRREFELDRNVAKQLGTQQVSQVLEKLEELDQKRIPADIRLFLLPYVAYWNPSIKERIRELGNPRLEDLPRPARIPKIGLRGRVIIVLVGFGIFWGAGLVESNFFARGQTMIVCTDVTCSALVVIAAVGFWMAIIGGISIVVWILRRFL